MKIGLYAILIIIMLSGWANAQQADSLSLGNIYSFLPSPGSTEMNTSLRSSMIIPEKSSFEKATGWFLQGLKFNSVLDQFSAISPFDLRTYQPSSFSQYQTYLHQNELLIKDPVPVLWPDR